MDQYTQIIDIISNLHNRIRIIYTCLHSSDGEVKRTEGQFDISYNNITKGITM